MKWKNKKILRKSRLGYYSFLEKGIFHSSIKEIKKRLLLNLVL